MHDTVKSDYCCGLCKKSFKQKSSLVRHAKKCSLEPTPSVRQKACRNCTTAKVRCDLQRPTCSRCSCRNIPCVYIRPSRTAGDNSASVSTRNCGPESNANSGTSPASGSSCGLLDTRVSLGAGAAAAAATTTTVAVTDADVELGTYLDCETDFQCLTGTVVETNGFFNQDFFPPRSLPALGPTESPGAGSGCLTTRSAHSNLDSTSVTPGTHRHRSASSGGGSLDVELDLSNANVDTEADLPLVPLAILESVQFEPSRLSLSAPESSIVGETPAEEIEPWILALAAKPTIPDPPELVNHSMQTLFRAFRSWPRMLAKGIQLPPIIHFFQFRDDGGEVGGVGTPQPLGRCITLCKMWAGQAENSEQIVQNAVKNEVECILAKYRTADAPTLLAAMQSLIILLLLLLFPSNRQSTFSVVPAPVFAAIQNMSYHALRTGMLLHEEAAHTRPPWRVWAHIEAKRRTLVTMYFLQWAYSVYHGTRHFNCLELGRMLAPGPKYLWQATDEKTWNNLYTRWLAQWNGRELVQAEFFLVERGVVMDPRVELWLEDADELGFLMLSIMNAAQRDLSKIPGAELNIVG
ncbi:hypothetical protein F5Y19DRAFT_28121 [Xylariaceae sp. FL1651]|nr:hypothetical protein F5Y19DRAFT_28121 [Xylariaceae sp. FL1651]